MVKKNLNYTRDIEEEDEALESSEGDALNFWEEKQRELLTSVVDYNLGTLVELTVQTSIDVSPQYQRRLRWKPERQSKLIESFLMNVPIPPIFLNEDKVGAYSVIDGKQRLTAISEFLRGRLALKGLEVFKDLNGSSFDDLPMELQNALRTRANLRAIIILRQSDDDVKFEVFQRLNTGGVRLNAQEIRNSAFPGPLNEMILELSESSVFHRALGIKKKNTSALYQEMRDAELVLRYLTFRTNWESFKGGMKRSMDHFMKDNQKASKQKLLTWKNEFLQTLEFTQQCFEEYAFRRWVPEKGHWRRQVLVSLFDAQMFACRGREGTVSKHKRAQILTALKRRFGDPEFRKSVDAATNTPTSFRARIRDISRMLDSLI